MCKAKTTYEQERTGLPKGALDNVNGISTHLCKILVENCLLHDFSSRLLQMKNKSYFEDFNRDIQ